MLSLTTHAILLGVVTVMVFGGPVSEPIGVCEEVTNVNKNNVRATNYFVKDDDTFTSSAIDDQDTKVSFHAGSKGAIVTKSSNKYANTHIRFDDGTQVHYANVMAGTRCYVSGSKHWATLKQVTYYLDVL